MGVQSKRSQVTGWYFAEVLMPLIDFSADLLSTVLILLFLGIELLIYGFSRYSDFIVNEINKEGEVVHLTDLSWTNKTAESDVATVCVYLFSPIFITLLFSSDVVHVLNYVLLGLE